MFIDNNNDDDDYYYNYILLVLLLYEDVITAISRLMRIYVYANIFV